ncbi:MAG: RsmE family RNA methyltransferase [Candidatus Marinimicrobia bacterium]|jgi:16S rRNA (uracil1498-N3)-methyltransferase|nr:RsmE family RNA methyltransferase [Candidatus Neomarinimicrobiota bacterium]MDP6612053.1 RsmE family RNA methyltransferase [Candidatus Neomarinimicrobiota bacterium]|tara:strand:- start:799 stop:1509 length:711 start_codon:yes stop_codon:yes gene_type:complete
MENHFFYLQQKAIHKNTFQLSEEESHHFLNSLRGKVGDDLWLLDGAGTAYNGTISGINGRSVSGIIRDSFPNYGESDYSIHLAIGLIKGNRMDMVLEKATELGAKSIQPLLLDRCVKNKLNLERAERIIISAAKQAGRSFFPIVFEPIDLSTWIKKHANDHKILFHIMGSQSLADALGNEKKEVFILVGPEGDFSKKELDQMEKEQFESAILAPRRLRSESAAIMAISVLNELMGN